MPDPPDASGSPSAADPLALRALFDGGGEPWFPLIAPVVARLPNAGMFVGPARAKTIVPVRELTFQALKPNPPQGWNVVAFGQNPYPRAASATGIAMFDNAFTDWRSWQLDRVASVRTIIKAALGWKHDVSLVSTPTGALREMLLEQRVVQPPEWFQAVLAQGVLLLNASLTASSDGALAIEQHTAFWRPVVQAIVEEILAAKARGPESKRGVVFAWWGAHARGLRALVEAAAARHPSVRVRHVSHCNPAAREEQFARGNHFAEVNRALADAGLAPVEWLPTAGWSQRHDAPSAASVARMGDFIAHTRELHRVYLERLAGVGDETLADLPPVAGVMASPRLAFPEAIAPAASRVAGLAVLAQRAREFAGTLAAKTSGPPRVGENQIAALHLYTLESSFYRALNAALRDPARAHVAPFVPYLRLLLSAHARLPQHTGLLYRGVAGDLREQYAPGRAVTWWGVSSCTAQRTVAQGFLGASARRMLFEVRPRTAASVGHYSAFEGEDEFVLLPGTRLRVLDAKSDPSGLCVVRLEELAEPRRVG